MRWKDGKIGLRGYYAIQGMLSNLQARISKPESHNDAVKLFPAKIKQVEEGDEM